MGGEEESIASASHVRFSGFASITSLCLVELEETPMTTEHTSTIHETPTTTTPPKAPPAPVPPPHLVRVRVDVDGAEYRQLKHLAIETSKSVNDMAAEGIRMLLAWYAAQNIASEGRQP
jgi:hypothetical protein